MANGEFSPAATPIDTQCKQLYSHSQSGLAFRYQSIAPEIRLVRKAPYTMSAMQGLVHANYWVTAIYLLCCARRLSWVGLVSELPTEQ